MFGSNGTQISRNEKARLGFECSTYNENPNIVPRALSLLMINESLGLV